MNSLTPWPPRSVEELGAGHLPALFDLAPEVVVLATGATQKFPRAALRAEFATRRIGLEVMEIGAACAHLQRAGERRAAGAGGGVVAGTGEAVRVKAQGEKVI